MNGGNEMNMKDVLYGFVNAPNASNPFKKPWVSFDNKNVVATNGRVLLSTPVERAAGYRKWYQHDRPEPIIDYLFWGKDDPNSFFKVKDDFYDMIEDKMASISGTGTVITPVEYRLDDMNYKFDAYQLIPIYNFYIYSEEELFYHTQGTVKPVLFKTLSGTKLAVMPLRTIRR